MGESEARARGASGREPAPEWRTCCASTLLALSAFAPLLPSGESAARWCLDGFKSGALQGVACLASVGLPFILGGMIAAASVRAPHGERAWTIRALRGGALLLHVQILVFASAWLREPLVIGRVALFGFALISFLAFGFQSEHARVRLADHAAAHRRWLTRWIAAILAPFAAWCRLQTIHGVRLGLGVDLVLLCALLLVFSAGRERVRVR